jgi:uncharacterized protein (DUF1684 family)
MYKDEIEKFRKQKDTFFKTNGQSPLKPEQRPSFSGLSYYPVNEDLALHLEAKEFEDKEEIEMQTSTGDLRTYLRWGTVTFTVDGEEATLTLYFSPAHRHFFLPFMDATSGDETYGAGRYIDPHPLEDNIFQVDFNQAYSPYCAYNENYSCPIPPQENRLKVAIRAGEKSFTE